MQDQSAALAEKSSKRNLRKYIDFGMPIVGMQIVISVMLFTQALPTVAYIVLAVVLIEVGIWKLAPKLLPDNRKYNALRTETDRFLVLVRQLNTVALKVKESDTPENRESVEKIHKKMQVLLDRIVSVAGKTDYELSDASNLDQRHDTADVMPSHDRSNEDQMAVKS